MSNEEILDSLNLVSAGGPNNIVIRVMEATRKDEAEKLNGDFIIWVVENKWEYDVGEHKWFNNYIREVSGVKATHKELYQIFRSPMTSKIFVRSHPDKTK